jgi:hypothetical protein
MMIEQENACCLVCEYCESEIVKMIEEKME